MKSAVLMSQRDVHLLHALLSVRDALPPADAASRRALSDLLGQAKELPSGRSKIRTVGLDDTVTLRFTATPDEDGDTIFQIVLPASGSPAHGRISVLAPVSLGVLGRKVGQRVQIATPEGEREAEIIHIAKAQVHVEAS